MKREEVISVDPNFVASYPMTTNRDLAKQFSCSEATIKRAGRLAGLKKGKGYWVSPRKLSLTSVLDRFSRIHGDRYDYRLVEYQDASTPVMILCQEHGVFSQTPQNHMSGCGCPRCHHARHVANKKALAATVFANKAAAKHGNKYDYSRVKYVKSDVKVEIICPEHGSFFQAPSSHLYGHGCTLCGIEVVRNTKTKKDTRQDLSDLVESAVRLCGGFPTHEIAVKHGLYDFVRVVRKFGGFETVRSEFGYPNHINRWGGCNHKSGHWKSRENVVAYFLKNFPVMYEMGQCPSCEMMEAVEHPSFLQHFGGISGVCTLFGLKPAKGYLSRDGHLVRSYFELLLDEYLYSRGIKHEPEVEPFEGLRYRCDQKVGDLYVEIWGLKDEAYVNKRKVKECLYARHGLTLIGLEIDFFSTSLPQTESRLDRIFSERGLCVAPRLPFNMRDIAKKVHYPWTEARVKEEIVQYVESYGTFPTQKTMSSNGYSALAGRIHQFGGFPYFRKLMGYPAYQMKRHWSEQRIIDELQTLCSSLGRFPLDKELPGSLRNSMRNRSYIESHDLNHYRKLLGYEVTRASNGYWTPNTIEDELRKTVQSFGRFPSNMDLKKMGKGALSSAIQAQGGFSFWRSQLGCNQPC